MTTKSIKPFEPGQNVRTIRPRLEEIRRRVTGISQVSGPGVSQTGQGTLLRPRRPFQAGVMRDVIDVFWAIVTGNEDFVGDPAYRWKYEWSESEFVTDSIQALSPAAGYRSGTTTTDYALHLDEAFYTDQYQAGVDVNGTDYPEGFGLRPVGGAGTDNTHKVDMPVIMYEVIASGAVQYWFEKFNSHDGTCDAPA